MPQAGACSLGYLHGARRAAKRVQKRAARDITSRLVVPPSHLRADPQILISPSVSVKLCVTSRRLRHPKVLGAQINMIYSKLPIFKLGPRLQPKPSPAYAPDLIGGQHRSAKQGGTDMCVYCPLGPLPRTPLKPRLIHLPQALYKHLKAYDTRETLTMSSIPTTMRALIVQADKKVAVEERPVPAVGPNEILYVSPSIRPRVLLN